MDSNIQREADRSFEERLQQGGAGPKLVHGEVRAHHRAAHNKKPRQGDDESAAEDL